MPRVKDYHVSSEVQDIMESIVERFPSVFEGFDVSKIGVVHTKKKASRRRPLRIVCVRYPVDVWLDKTYIVEVAEKTWQDLTQKQKNLAVFHTMCAFPEGAFDESSKNYGKKKQPDYEMFAEEFAVTNGVPNWMENPEARDPFEVNAEDLEDDSEEDVEESGEKDSEDQEEDAEEEDAEEEESEE